MAHRTEARGESVRGHRVERLLFVLLFGTYAYFYQSTQHNEAARFDQMRALVEEHTLAIDHFWWNSADIIHYPRNGHNVVYPNKPPGGTLLGLGPFLLFTRGLAFFHLPEWAYWHAVTYLTICGTVSLFSALAGVAMFRVLQRIGGSSLTATISVIGVWLGTLCFPYSTMFFSHQLAATLLSFAFVLLFNYRHASASSSASVLPLFGAGFLLGFSVVTEYPAALLTGILGVYFLCHLYRSQGEGRMKLSLAASFFAGGLLATSLLLTYNLVAFGKAFYVPIEAYATAGSQFQTYRHGLLGFQWRGLPAFGHALAAITFQPEIGMLYLGLFHGMVYGCNPILWLALPGAIMLLLRPQWRAEGLLVVAMIVAYLFFITSYGTWEYDWAGGSYIGSRHLIPLLPFLSIPLAMAADRVRWLAWLLVAVSVFYMLLATAIEPRLAYPSENPARDVLLPEFLRGHFAQNTARLFGDESHYLTEDSTAFNLPKLLFVPGQYQLLPLMLFWSILGGLLLSAARRKDEDRTASGGLSGGRGKVKSGLSLAPLYLFCAGIAFAPVCYHAASARNLMATHGLLGSYYRNAQWLGPPAEVHVDPRLDLDWSKTMPLQPPFSVNWEGELFIDQPGDYNFGLSADDGAALEIDGQKLIDVLNGPVLQRKDAERHLTAGEHSIRVRYVNILFGGSIHLWWRSAYRPEQIVPTDVLTPKRRNATAR